MSEHLPAESASKANDCHICERALLKGNITDFLLIIIHGLVVWFISSLTIIETGLIDIYVHLKPVRIWKTKALQRWLLKYYEKYCPHNLEVSGCLVLEYTLGWSIVVLVSSCDIVLCSICFHSLSSLKPAYLLSFLLNWRKKASANVNRSKNTRTKPRNPVESRESSSDSDMEVLGDKTKIKELPCHKRNNQFNKVNNLGMKKKQHISCTPSTSSFTAMNEVTPNNSSDDESNLSDAMIVQPTPCSKTTRSIFTKRRHRSPISTFDQLDDTEEHHLCELQTQNKKRHSPKCTNRTLNTPGRKKTKAAFTTALRSDVQITLSPFVNTKKQKRKRIKSISSDSDWFINLTYNNKLLSDWSVYVYVVTILVYLIFTFKWLLL